MPSRRGIACGFAAAALCALPCRALSQDSPGETTAPAAAAPAAPRFGEEIVVTGSRIPRKDLTTPAPVTVVTREEIRASGFATVADFVQALPAQANGFNRGINNNPTTNVSTLVGFAAEGGTFVSLRGLGAHRTLVLVDGRRLPPNGPSGEVDLAQIPDAVVERVEILKDGASPVYGADAVAGVVNVITRRRVDGVEASAFGGATTHGDGTAYGVAATAGLAGERGRALLSAELSQQGDVMAGSRPFSAVPRAFSATGARSVNNSAGRVGEIRPGSSFVPAGRLVLPSGAQGQALPNPTGDPRIARYNALVTTWPGATSFVPDPRSALGFRPYAGNDVSGDGYNFAPENYLLTPLRRVAVFGSGDVSVARSARAYFQGSYTNRRSDQRLAPLPFRTDGAGMAVSADNPFNPFGAEVTVWRRMTELGPRTFAQDADTFRAVAGVDGTLPDALGPLRGWTWDLSATYGRMNQRREFGGEMRLAPLAAALGPGYADPAGGGRYLCGSPGATIPGCTPLDLFAAPGAIPRERLAALTYVGHEGMFSQLVQLQANATGDLFQLAAHRPVALAVGYEYRAVAGGFTPDALAAAGQSTALPPNVAFEPTAGRYHVDEGYAELSVPIASGAPAAEALEAFAAARAFRYSTVDRGDWTYKLGARWAPVRDATLRGTWSTAYRAPTILERFFGQLTGTLQGPSLQDPCADLSGAPAARVAACGAAANNGNLEPAVFVRLGGDARLVPEKARVYTAGVVLEPHVLRGLGITLDYWDVSISDAIAAVDPALLLAACYPATPGARPRLCDRVERDPVSQAVRSIDARNMNVGEEQAAGVDVGVRYGLPTALGRFGFAFDGTWLRKHDVVNPDGSVVHGRGNDDLAFALGGAGGVNPAWRFHTGVSWRSGRLGASAGVRFVGSLRECGDAQGEFAGLGVCSVDPTYQRHVPAWAATDAMVSYDVEAGGRTRLALGAQNLFDRAPPTLYNGFLAASDPTAYDFAGRFVWLRVAYTP